MPFDPDQALRDETYWYPKGLTTEDGQFMLNTTDMIALNRYVTSGIVLPATQEEYTRRLSIDWEDLNTDVKREVGDMILTYGTIKTDTTEFYNITWPGIVNLADRVYNYATVAGGTLDDSFYATMLLWVGQYNKELGKENPDQAQVKKFKDAILEITTEQLASIQTLQDASKKTREVLAEFEKKCLVHKQSLKDSKTNLDFLLVGENGEVNKLQNDIKDQRRILKAKQVEYDNDIRTVEQTALYVWIPLIGTIAGPVVAAQYNALAKEVKAAMVKIQAKIEEEEEKIGTDTRVIGDITAMDDEVDSLNAKVGPAIETIQKLEGAWETIYGDLEGIHDLVENQTGSIPSDLMEEKKLTKIINQWNKLAEFVDTYRKTAYLSSPEDKTIKEYIAELDV